MNGSSRKQQEGFTIYQAGKKYFLMRIQMQTVCKIIGQRWR